MLEFLAPSGLAVSPSRLIAPGPHRHDGLWMTFTEWIPEVAPSPEVQPATHLADAHRLGRTLRDLHDQLRPFKGELGGLRELREAIERLLGQLRNLLRTPRRLVWNDFEDTFRGPVHWDVASYAGSLRIHGASERSLREMLEAYGWEDEQELAPFLAAQDAYDEIWRMYDRQRRRLARTAAP